MEKIKKILKIAGDVITLLLVVLAVFMIIFTVISTAVLDESERNFLGSRGFVVLSDSMSATDFDAGDIVFIRSIDPAKLKEGDIISYLSPETGDFITHKIRRLTETPSGEPGFITYGTTTDTDDKITVTYSMVAGKYQFSLPGIGKILSFVRTGPGYLLTIFTPLTIIVVLQTINTIKLYRQYKAAQLEENREVADVKQETALAESENARIREELEALRAQLREFVHSETAQEEENQ